MQNYIEIESNQISEPYFTTIMMSDYISYEDGPFHMDFGIDSESIPNPASDSRFSGQNQVEGSSRGGGMHRQGAYLVPTSIDKAARKKENDKRYREKTRKEKVEMKTQLEKLYDENEKLKQENDSTNILLKAQIKEINQLKSMVDKLSVQGTKQNALVDSLSAGLANSSDLLVENLRLKHEIGELKLGLDHQVAQLAEENGLLKREVMVLKVHNDALCAKIINDENKKFEMPSSTLL